jgi:alginate O-acetyltransferase complex protein AlgJ
MLKNTMVSRRAVLGGAAAATLALGAPRPSAASIMGLVVVGADGWLYPVWDEVRSFDQNKFNAATKAINSAVAIMKRAGIEAVISLTPVKSRIYPDYMPADFQWSQAALNRYQLSLDVLRQPGTLVPDLDLAMRNARKAKPADLYFFKTDTHWTPLGSEVCAAVISREMLAKFRLPPSAKPGVALGDYMDMIQSKNDLYEQLSAVEKAKLGRERYKIRREVGADVEKAALVDDDSSDIELIGNSYTQPKYGYPQALSHGLNRPVGLTWRVHQYGSYAILLEYLKSASFKQSRPKVIIWDFEEIDMEGPPEMKDFWGDHAMSTDAFLGAVQKAVGA